MPLHDRLGFYAYNLATGTRSDLTEAIEDLTFTTVAPGGYGDLSCKLKVPDARNIPTELRIFSNIALMDLQNPNATSGAVFLGRWDEPGTALDQQDGDLFNLHAMGAATCMKDDPSDTAYVAKTANQIVTSEFSAASVYLLLDSDTSQVLTDAPTATYSPAFNGKTLEEKINELSPVLQANSGTHDYQWCVWDHPYNRDALGFPTWQFSWHQRDTTTISYTGFFEQTANYDIRPAVEYSYNVIQVKYRDATTDAASSVTVTDTRLGAGGAQGTAPFPRRKLVKDLSSDHLSSGEATNIANALLNQYQNGGFKITVTLTGLLDANGTPIPLWQCRADRNIYLPQLAQIGLQLPTAPTANTNVFYITETSYSESAGQAPQLTITANSFYDTASFQIARMQYIHQGLAQDGKKHHTVRAAGEPERGKCGVGWGSTALANDIYESGTNYKTAMTALPTSITLSVSVQSNTKSVATGDSSLLGFQFQATVNANGTGFWRGLYITAGN